MESEGFSRDEVTGYVAAALALALAVTLWAFSGSVNCAAGFFCKPRKSPKAGRSSPRPSV